MSLDTQVELLKAESELRVAYQIFYGTPPLSRLDAVGKVLNAESELRIAYRRHREDGMRAGLQALAKLAELAGSLSRGAELCAVKQSHSNFLAREASDSGDGWTWPVHVMKSGWASGSVEGASGKETTPHYFPPEIVAEVAQAVNGARFRRRHPETGDGSDAPELTAGWMTNGRMIGSAAVATVNLLRSETGIRSTLLAAQEAGKLDLFSVSILGYFNFQKSQIDGKPALVAKLLQKFVGLDMCAEGGAGGKFLPAAAV